MSGGVSDGIVGLRDLLVSAREYVADALEAHEHSDGRTLLFQIDAALKAQGASKEVGFRVIDENTPRSVRDRILIKGHRGNEVDIAHWGSGRFLGRKQGYEQGWVVNPGQTVKPTHWMPIPDDCPSSAGGA